MPSVILENSANRNPMAERLSQTIRKGHREAHGAKNVSNPPVWADT